MKKKVIARLLVLVMVAAAMLPVAITAVSAAYGYGPYSQTADTAPVEDVVVNEDSGEVTIKAVKVGKTARKSLTEKEAEKMVNESTWKVEADEGVNKVEFSVPAKALAANGEATGESLVLTMGDLATVTIPNSVLTSSFNTAGTAKFTAQAAGNGGVNLTILVSSKNISLKGITITL